MQTDPSKIRQLLKKTTHFDKDERFMATSDLTTELEKVDGKLDSSLQTPIRDAILKQLDDSSNDVQAIACRCLSAIVQKFNAEQVEEIVDKLGGLLVDGKMELRDIYTIAIKNIISSVPEEYGQQISKKLNKRLLEGFVIKKQSHNATNEEKQEFERNKLNKEIFCLDLMKDLIARFGFLMTDEHQLIINTIQPMLNGENKDIRKKVAVTLGALSACVNDNQFQTLMNNVITSIDKIKTQKNNDKLFTYIQTIGVFCRNAGQRISLYLKQIVPLLISISMNKDLDDNPTDASKELRENCLIAFETMILTCPKQMSIFSKDIINLGLTLMIFDPNYEYNDDNDVTMNDNENKNNDNNNDNEFGDDDGFGDDDDADFGDDDGWGDDDNNDDNKDGDDGWDDGDAGEDEIIDDDTSWKVRRAAVKMLNSFIKTHKQQINEYQKQLCNSLLKCFREHDVNVKLEIFKTFRELLLATIVLEAGSGNIHSHESNLFEAPPLLRQVSEFELMASELPNIMKAIVKQFKNDKNNSKRNNILIKNGLLSILMDLVLVRQAERSERCQTLTTDGLKEYFNDIIPEIVKCCNNNDIQLKTKGLYLIYILLKKHSTNDACLILNDIQKVIIDSVTNNYSRVKTQGMIIITRICECIRPLNNDANLNYNNKFDNNIKELFLIAFKQLSLRDVEGEVKKAALTSTSSLLSHFGDTILKNDIKKTLDILLDRLKNEITRQTSLQCFTLLANSPLNINLNNICNKLIEQCCGFLKKNSTQLKIETALTIKSIVKSCNKNLNNKLINEIIIYILVNNDNNIKNIGQIMNANVFPKCFKFLHSPLLQGSALSSLITLFASFQRITGEKIIKFNAFKTELIKCAIPKLSRQSYTAISRCLSILILQLKNNDQYNATNELIKLIDDNNDNYSQLSLLCIGEIGKKIDLSKHGNIENKIYKAFNRDSESVKWAASYALGSISCGNMDKYIVILLKMVKEHKNRQYLLLNSLKEIIIFHYNNENLIKKLKPYSKQIVTLLFEYSESKDEGTRSMVSECLGKFTQIDNNIFNEINKLLKSQNDNIKATMAGAIKYSLDKNISFYLPPNTVKIFLNLLSDNNINVQRQSFLTINSILHVNNKLIVKYLNDILPLIYKNTITNTNLIREVDLGPFKHRVDDGLPLRKASFQCLDTLLDSTPNSLDIVEFLKYLVNGINDESPDIQMLTYQVLTKLALNHGQSIIQNLDILPGKLMKGIKGKMNEAKSQKDGERARDILRTAVKALYTLRNIPNVNKARKFVTFYSRVEKTKILIPMIAELKKDNKNKK